MASSLFDELKGPWKDAPQGFASTDLPRLLIQYVGHDVCKLRRNTQVSFRIVDRARTIWAQLNDLVAAIDEVKTNDWKKYDNFVAAVDPLEECVYVLLLLALFVVELTAK